MRSSSTRGIETVAIGARGSLEASALDECPNATDVRHEPNQHPCPTLVAVVPALHAHGDARPEDRKHHESERSESEIGWICFVSRSTQRDGDEHQEKQYRCQPEEQDCRLPIVPPRRATLHRKKQPHESTLGDRVGTDVTEIDSRRLIGILRQLESSLRDPAMKLNRAPASLCALRSASGTP